jgi:elongation factor Ts
VALGTDGDVAALGAATLPSTGKSVVESITDAVATIGENMQLRRSAVLSVGDGVVASYVHNQVSDGLGKIGVLVALEGDAPADVLEPLGKQIAMHIAAAFPLALSSGDIDPALLERERAIASEKAAESGKPAEIVAKMVDGAVAKFAKENALLSQLFVMDNKTPVGDVVAKAAKDAGKSITPKSYVRFQLGEGIEKEVSDFAAEVAAAAGVS